MRRLGSILLWSVIAGAFIGPGTVVTAASAGAAHGLALVWAVVFSTLTCLLLQEASARLTVLTGDDLGRALRRRFSGGVLGVLIPLLVLGAVVLGCAAYEAGNILGAVAGASGLGGFGPRTLAVLITAVAALLLWLGSPATVARSLSVLVATMGAAFVVTAIGLRPDPAALLAGSLTPSLPPGSTLLVVGLIGTTVVPYNLFLGSSLAHGQQLREVRLGLAVSVGLGGLISAAIVVVGSAVDGGFSFAGLSEVLAGRLGPWAAGLFGLGLLAAGLTSAVTAPLAAALTVRGLALDERWHARGWRFRAVWAGVLLVGAGFGMAGIKPAPAILAAQVLNGILLPVVAAVLVVAVNDRPAVGHGRLPGVLHTSVMIGAVGVAAFLGATSVLRAWFRVLASAEPAPERLLALALAVAAASVAATAVAAARARRGPGAV
jgi:Mn2+/Fe2+ NRAMP family transporter